MEPTPRYRDWLRDGLYLGGLGLCSPWILYRLWTQPRRRSGMMQRLRGLAEFPADRPPENTVWFHGVSVGEIQLLAPLVREFTQRLPEVEPVLSTTTSSGKALAQRLVPDYPVFFFPFDFSWAIRRTMNCLTPRLIVLGELELWPNLIAEANRRQIPVVVVNGRLSDRSYAGYRRARLLCKHMFQGLSLVAAQNHTYAERFRQCGCPANRVVVTGNTKFDNVEFDRDCPQVTQLRQLSGLTSNYKVLMAGSTQGPEEDRVARAYRRLSELHPDLRLVIVPRHPDRFDQVWKELNEQGFKVMRRSRITSSTDPAQWDVLLVDTVGELRWWWGLADIALVGGSFGDRGGQNMLEPAAYGANVLFGPNTSNFRDIARALLDADAAKVVPSLEAIESTLRHELDHPDIGLARGQRAQQFVQSQQGAMQQTMEHLIRLCVQKADPPISDSRANG